MYPIKDTSIDNLLREIKRGDAVHIVTRQKESLYFEVLELNSHFIKGEDNKVMIVDIKEIKIKELSFWKNVGLYYAIGLVVALHVLLNI